VAFAMLERLLGPDEPIFTSMDERPISDDRARPLGHDEPEVAENLARLAQQVYSVLGLQSLIRLDVRADAGGALHVLEANPKPDLKRPGAGVSSLIMIGRASDAASYRDLIYGLLADRLHYLFMYRSEAIRHILDLIPPSRGSLRVQPHVPIGGGA
jgi:D-alanine-D-alanine ligase